jgi:hypothetical protein
MAKQQSRKSKSKDERPARKRYWTRRKLEQHKVRQLVKWRGITYEQALKVWQQARKGRVPNDFFKKSA